MTLDNFRTLIRAYVPSAKISVVDNTLLDLMINEGVKDVNIYAMAMKANKKFTATANQQEYAFSTVIDDFITMDEAGLWWNAGSASSTDWRRMDPYERASLDDMFPRWKDDAVGSPFRYFIENDTLTVHPTVETTLSNGFWAFYIRKPTSMTLSTHYPFSGSTTEIGALSVLDDAIVDYVRWKIARIVGQYTEGTIPEGDYRKNLAAKILILKTRLDISGTPGIRMRGPTFG